MPSGSSQLQVLALRVLSCPVSDASIHSAPGTAVAAVRNYSLEMFLGGKRGYRTENSVFLLMLFLGLLLPSFVVEIILLSPE